jgi:hypothetical protein
MGLVRGIARTAVVAGTATAVSNRVSRRQANKWGAQDQQAAEAEAYEQQQAAPPPQQAYAPPPPAAPAAPDRDEMFDQLQKLGELKEAGVLTEEEFAAQKAKILAG